MGMSPYASAPSGKGWESKMENGKETKVDERREIMGGFEESLDVFWGPYVGDSYAGFGQGDD